jgi:PAS domain S-box-containing protein
VTSRLAVPLLAVTLSLAGFLVITHAIDADRGAAANRRADAAAQQIRVLLERGTAFSIGLGDTLAGERRPAAARFAAVAGSSATTVGLTGGLWVERVGARGRRAYERRLGNPITRYPYPYTEQAARSYLPVTFVTGLPLTPGADVGNLSALGPTLRDPASIFAGTATPVTELGGRRGFFIVQGARFGHGPGSHGYLAVFVPAGWLTQSLAGSPDRVAISLDGQPLTNPLPGHRAASQSFGALARHWRVDVAREPATAVQGILPPLALAWPPLTALLGYLLARGLLRRRRAERQVDDIFDLSPDLLGIVAGDGHLKRVNPAFERTLGYPAADLVDEPLLEHVHPDDREATAQALARVTDGPELASFESRFVRSDGAVRSLEWVLRSMPERGLMYAAARDVTENRELVDELAASRKRIVRTADDTRRRLERDLHDGAQQRLVVLTLELRAAQEQLDPDDKDLAAALERVAEGMDEALDELREFARGVHPAILVKGGLGPALHALARRSAIPVRLELATNGRLSPELEVAAYYVISEALTNAVKHSGAEVVEINVEQAGDSLRLVVADSGRGGARPGEASGLVGLRDRVEAIGGRLSVDSPPGEGTRLVAELPLPPGTVGDV